MSKKRLPSNKFRYPATKPPLINMSHLLIYLMFLLIFHVACVYMLKIDITNNGVFNLITSAMGYVLGQIIPSNNIFHHGETDDQEEENSDDGFTGL